MSGPAARLEGERQECRTGACVLLVDGYAAVDPQLLASDDRRLV